jgi:hypothetical protein
MNAVATTTRTVTSADVQAGLAAGFFGGVAEVLWIAMTASEPAVVARGVIGTIFPSMAQSSNAVALGVTAHMLIALALGVALAVGVRWFLSRVASPAKAFAVFASLIAVWAINFFVVLPVWNPEFVTLVPYSVSLISKALFGVAAAFTLIGMYRRSKA